MINKTLERSDFVFDKADGATATGTVTTYAYGAKGSCDGTPDVTTAPFSISVDKFPTATTGNAFTGTLDKVTITSPGYRDQTINIGFDTGFGSFRFDYSSEISESDVVYTRQ